MFSMHLIRRKKQDDRRHEYVQKRIKNWFDQHENVANQQITASDIKGKEKVDGFTQQEISHLFPKSRNKDSDHDKRLSKYASSELKYLSQLEEALILKIEKEAQNFDRKGNPENFRRELIQFMKKTPEYKEFKKYKSTKEDEAENSILNPIFGKYIDKKMDEIFDFLSSQIQDFLKEELPLNKSEEMLTIEMIEKTVTCFLKRISGDNEIQDNDTYSKLLYTKMIVEWNDKLNRLDQKDSFNLIHSIGEKIKYDSSFIDKIKTKKLKSSIDSRNKKVLSKGIYRYVFSTETLLDKTKDDISKEFLNFDEVRNDPEIKQFIGKILKESIEKKENFLKEKINKCLSPEFDLMYLDPIKYEKEMAFLKSKYEPYCFLTDKTEYDENKTIKKVHDIFSQHRLGVNGYEDKGEPKFSDEEFKYVLKTTIELADKKRTNFLGNKIRNCLSEGLKSCDFDEFKKVISFLKEKDSKNGYDYYFYPTDYDPSYQDNLIIKEIHSIFQKIKDPENKADPKYSDEEIKSILISIIENDFIKKTEKLSEIILQFSKPEELEKDFFKTVKNIKYLLEHINNKTELDEIERHILIQQVVLPKLRLFLLEKGVLSYHAHLIHPENVLDILKIIEKNQSKPNFWEYCKVILSKTTKETNSRTKKETHSTRTIWRFINEILSIENPDLLTIVMDKIRNDEKTLLSFQSKTTDEIKYLEKLKKLRGNPKKYEELKFSKVHKIYETKEWKDIENLIRDYFDKNEKIKKIGKKLINPREICKKYEKNDKQPMNPIGYNVVNPAEFIAGTSEKALFAQYPHIREEIFAGQSMLFIVGNNSDLVMDERSPLSMIGYQFLSHHAISLLEEARGIVWDICRRYHLELIDLQSSEQDISTKEHLLKCMKEISDLRNAEKVWLHAMKLVIKRRELTGLKCGNGTLEEWEENLLCHIFRHYENERDGTSF